jgi:hypothetical protein
MRSQRTEQNRKFLSAGFSLRFAARRHDSNDAWPYATSKFNRSPCKPRALLDTSYAAVLPVCIGRVLASVYDWRCLCDKLIFYSAEGISLGTQGGPGE